MSQSDDPATLEIYQDQLLELSSEYFEDEVIPKELIDAFKAVPRHRFIPSYFAGNDKGWITITPDNLNVHLDLLYGNHPLCIHQNAEGKTDSTISQPSLVLLMLDLLELEPGHKVFELGAGSGWNAALMGKLVGPTGSVRSIEIIDSLVSNAQDATKDLDLNNVFISSGDGAKGLPEHAPFDRGVFTAAADSLPACFFEQIKEDGLLLLVIRINENYDLLTVLRKSGQSFESEYHFKCRFVPVTGKEDQSDARHTENLACRKWVELGEPEVDELDLKIHPAGTDILDLPQNWTIEHQSCILEWSRRP